MLDLFNVGFVLVGVYIIWCISYVLIF